MKKLVVGILAHVDAGKTTLSESMLYLSGAIRKMGRVDNKDAFLDTYELERERGITIFSKQAVFRLKDTEVMLLDTPGHVDFSAEMERTLQVLDYAILVVSGADGVQGHTLTLWKLLQRYQIPVFIFVNKMDQSGVVKGPLMVELRKRLSEGCVDFTEQKTNEFYENVAMCEEHLIDYFLEHHRLEVEQIGVAIKNRKVFPCFFGSALKVFGVIEFMQSFENFTLQPKYPAEFGAKVFKITRDEQDNRLTYLKVTGGSLKVKETLMPLSEKINQIRIYNGAKYDTVGEAKAGTICAVVGLTGTRAGEGFGIEKEAALPMLEPVLNYQILLPEGYDAALMLPKLRMLEEEIPELHVVWKEELKEIHVQIMGEVQTEIIKSLVFERYRVPIGFGPGNIVYKETISNVVEGIGHFEPLRHYAEVHLKLEPLEEGSGLSFCTDCSEDLLTKNWQRLIMTHLYEKEHVGVLTGSAITDMKITLVAGRAHIKHTEGGDFRQATYRAVRQGLMRADSVLLEPYYEFRMELPENAIGRAMTDIDKMFGKMEAPQIENGTAILTGYAPVVCMRDYQIELISYTKGHGRLSLGLKGYYPCHNTEEVLEEISYEPEADLNNPTGSVFCAHGAGFVVPWDEVEEYMHLEGTVEGYQNTFGQYAEQEKMQENIRRQEEKNNQAGNVSLEEFIDIEEIDQIINRASSANKKEDFIPHKGISKRIHKQPDRNMAPLVRDYSKQGEKIIKEKYLLVDGYNIIFACEELNELAKDTLDGARGKLMDLLCNYQAMLGIHVILVFDAYRLEGHQTEVFMYHNIHVVYTKEAETADQYIEKFAHENSKKFEVTVATSDGLEQIIIRSKGCYLVSARELMEDIKASEQRNRENFIENQPKGRSFLFDALSENMKKEVEKLL